MTIEAEADIRRKEAAEWFTTLSQRKVTTADIKAFSVWRRDPGERPRLQPPGGHVGRGRNAGKHPGMAALTEDAANRARQASTKGGRRTSGRLVPLGAAGAIALALVVGSWSWWSAQRSDVYDTAIGEQRTVRLEDGSRIILDTASHVTVRFSVGPSVWSRSPPDAPCSRCRETPPAPSW